MNKLTLNYHVTKQGKVYCLENKKEIKPLVNKSGYKYVKLGYITALVHHLVLQTYYRNPKEKEVCNHKDGNKLNNKIENLEWVTYGENLKHAYDTGLRKRYVKIHLKDRLKIKESKKDKYILAKKYNVHPRTIQRIQKGK